MTIWLEKLEKDNPQLSQCQPVKSVEERNRGVNIARRGLTCVNQFLWPDKKYLIIGKTKTGNDNDKEECQT